MKLLILIVLCAGALSVPLGSQDDPLAEFLQKVLEANPQDNIISGESPLVNPDQTENELTTLAPTEVKTETSVTEEDNLAKTVEERGSTTESQDNIKLNKLVSGETAKVNISNTETTNNDKALDEQILEDVNEDTVSATEDQTTIPPELFIDDKMEGPFPLDVSVPQTENQNNDPSIFVQNEENINYDGDAIVRIPLDRQDNWNPNPYVQDRYEPINKDYEDHMTMLSNPYLSPMDTLPLDPSLMDDSMSHHENLSPDYQFYDYIDETGSNVNNAHDEEAKITPIETTVMEENLTSGNQVPIAVEFNNDTTLTVMEDSKGIQTAEDQNAMDPELLSYDEIPATTMNEMKDDQQFEPNSMDINMNDLHIEAVNADEQSAISEFKESQFQNSLPMKDMDYDTTSMNNEEFIPRYTVSSKIPYDSFAQYMTRDDMNNFNPYTFNPNSLDDMLYRSLLQDENSYYNLRDNLYPEDRKPVFNYDMNTGIQRDDLSNQVTYDKSMMQDSENLDMKDEVTSSNKMGYYNGMENDAYSMVGSDFTPMSGALPLLRQNPIVEISPNSEKESSTSNIFSNNEQDISMMLYNRHLRNLGKSSFYSNSRMNQFNNNPFRRNNVPMIFFVDSASRNVDNNMESSNQVSESEVQENEMENAYINDDGTLLTDIQHNINIPYSPGYHPSFYPWHHYYNINQYPFGYKAQRYYDMTKHPYSSNINYFPSQYDAYNSRYTGYPFKSGNYHPYSNLNFYAQPHYYRRNPLSYINSLYY